VLKDLSDFSLKTNLKEKCLSQLYALIVCLDGEGLQEHTEKLLKNIIYKNILEEGNNGESEIGRRTYKIAELLGFYLDCAFLLPMMLAHLHDSESKSVPRFVSSCLTAIGAVVKNVRDSNKDKMEVFMP